VKGDFILRMREEKDAEFFKVKIQTTSHLQGIKQKGTKGVLHMKQQKGFLIKF